MRITRRPLSSLPKINKRTAAAVMCVVVAASTVLATNGADAAPVIGTEAKNCVIETHGIDAEGNFITSPIECYATFADSLRASGVQDVPDDATPQKDGMAAANVAYGIIGVHYDGPSGTGPAMTVTGNVCGGGGLNVPGPWNDKITSTYNGCPSIIHWENGGYSGASQSTFGIGNLTTLGAIMDNRTTSMRYYG